MKRTIPPAAFIGIIAIFLIVVGGAYAVLAQPELSDEAREAAAEGHILRRPKPKKSQPAPANPASAEPAKG
jgi:hypothetical protein